MTGKGRERPWWRRAVGFAIESHVWEAFAIFTACAGAAYLLGYLDGAREREP